MSHEVELKFDLAPGDVERLRACPALADGPPRIAHYETRYFDTRDDLLRGAGFSLRIRRADGRYTQTVKRKRASRAGLFVRQEWDRPVAGFALDQGALKSTPLKRLLGKVKPKALASRVRTRFRRSSWLIERRGSRIEVVLDEGVVVSGKAEAPLCEVELELIEGKPRALFELAGEIGAAVPLRLGVLSKQERGLALAEGRLGRAARAEPIALAAPLTEADAFRAVAHACLHHYRLNEIVLLGSADPDALHQARIALRRLRSALSLFRPTVRGKDLHALRDELGWLAGQFGDARNLDVLLAGEPALAGNAALLRKRDKAYDRVAAALRADRALRLLLRLPWWIESGPWRFRDRAGGDASVLASGQLERQWRKVRREASHMGAADADQRHRLRLDVKKLRYSAEFFAGLYGKRAKAAGRDRFIAALKDLQDRLGDLGDAEAAETITRRPRRPGLAEDGMAAAEDALHRATVTAGYWL
jgi:inorganic triphosphatase YgiF